MFLDGARIGTSDGDLDDDEEVLHRGHCSIGSDLYAPGLVAHGKTTLDSATIGRNVHLDRARLPGPPPLDLSLSPTALDATNLTVGSDFSAVALTASGALGLRGRRSPAVSAW